MTTNPDWLSWAGHIRIPEAGGVASSTREWRGIVARRVLRLCAEECDAEGRTYPTLRDLAASCGISISAVRDALWHLQRHELIAAIERPTRRRVYYLDPLHNPAYQALTGTPAEARAL